MKKIQLACLLAVLAVLAAAMSLSPAQAQVATQFYASPAGSGGACSAAVPCSLQTAIGQASMTEGTVSCIDGGNYGSTITPPLSVTIDCPGAVLIAVGVPTITLNGSSVQVVILRNLIFEGRVSSGAPFIKVTGGATLIIENCKFQNLGNGNAIAIQYQPTSPAAQLIIRDSVFANDGIVSSGAGGGLQVAPGAGGSASVVLERVAFNLNATGMVLSGPVNATMVDSTVSASRSNGILVGTGATLDIKNSTLVYNVGAAISVASGGTVLLSNNDIKSNQIGISKGGGQALTYANNRIRGNGSTATLTSVQGGQ
jgi:hypothetical protein